MSVSAVLFDMDGTLLDTLEDIYLTVNEVFREWNYPEVAIDDVRMSTGHGAAYLLASLLPKTVDDEEVELILKRYKPLLKKNQNNNTHPYPGIIELLNELKKDGITSVINSNKPDEVVDGLKEIYFKDTVAQSLGDKDDIPKKPDPTGAYILLDKIGKSVKDALYVGDSETDIETAKNLGVPSVGVTWGFRSREVLESAGADYIIDSPAELLDIIAELNNRKE